MNLKEVVAIIGIQNRITVLTEMLCQTLGIQVFHAMKKFSPTQRIESDSEDAIILPPIDDLDETVVRMGLMATDHLLHILSGGPLDVNYTDPPDVFSSPLSWYIHRMTSDADIPAGWLVTELPIHYPWVNRPVGWIDGDGGVIVDFGQGKKLLKLPENYRDIFPMLEGQTI